MTGTIMVLTFIILVFSLAVWFAIGYVLGYEKGYQRKRYRDRAIAEEEQNINK